MTQEEKKLLLLDLCGRIPHGFIVHRYSDNRDISIDIDDIDGFAHFLEYSEGEEFKPYLRPMSSMTEEERGELRKFCKTQPQILEDIGVIGKVNSIAVIDFLNSHHFDYRWLIEKGLALEAPEDMYKIR